MKRLAKWVGIFLAIVIVAIVSLPFFINVNQFRPTLESELSAALGREVKLGDLQLKILAGEVTGDDLSVSEDPAFGKPAFVRAKSLRVGVELWPFILSRKLIVTYLVLDQPEVALVQSPSGDWNFSSLGGKSKKPPVPSSAPVSSGQTQAPLDLSVKLVKVTNGRVSLGRTTVHWKPLVLEQVNIEVRDFSSSAAFPFSLSTKIRGGGTLTLDGKAGPINPTDAASTPVSASLNVAQLDLAGSGMNDMAPDIAGLVSLKGAGESDGRSLHIKGQLKAEKLKLAKKGTPAARPVEFDFTVQHDLRKHAGVLHQGDIHIGSAPAHLTGTYAEQGQSMVLQMTLSGPNMPLLELASLLPAMAVVLPAGASLQAGTASVNLSMEGPADRLVTSGSLALNNARLAGFDLPKKMASIEKLAGIKAGPDTEIQTLSANVRVAPEGTRAQDIKLVVPAIGDLGGAGTVSPENALDFKMSAMVHTSGLMSVIGNTPIPFTVGGTCSEPVFRPDIKAVAREELKNLGGSLGKAGGLLDGLLGGKKKN
jgi:AsmA protein